VRPFLPALLPLMLATTLSAQTVEAARRTAAAGDTVHALALLDTILRRERRNAEAHYVAGQLQLARHVSGAAVSAPRRKAEEHFRYATRFAPDSAKYWIALADLFRSDNLATVRIQVPGLVERALAAAEKSGDSVLQADVAYRAARVWWERYEHFGRRYAPASAGSPLVMPTTFSEWKYWEEFIERGVRPIPTSGEDRDNATAALWTAMDRQPGHVAAAGLLAVALGEADRWEEAAQAARRLVRQVPDSGRAWAILGLALARTDRWTEAAAAFDAALRHMTPSEGEPYRDLGQIMRRADRLRWEQDGGTTQVQFDSLYWKVAQPLDIAGANELQAEFYARIAYADHRWTDPLRGYRGWEVDAGAVYVRFGPPDVWMVFDRSLIVWVYPYSRFRFAFYLQPGFAHARFADESREALRVAQEASPARFDNVAIHRTLDTILVQAAQFRGRPDTTDVAVFGAIPLGRILAAVPIADFALRSGAMVTDDAAREVRRDRREETVRRAADTDVQHRSWRLSVPAGGYLLRVEAYVPALNRGARSLEPLAVRPFPHGALRLSGLLAADRVQARDSTASRWSDFLIAPNGGRFDPGDPVALLWEIYDLAPDAAGQVRYGVELRVTVEALERRSFVARIIGGVSDATGLSAVGDDRIALAWERQGAAGREGALVEHVTVDLRDAPEGRYTVSVTVTDRATGGSASTERVLLINRDPPARVPPITSFR
jgi:GWxTD domain-containing protein